MDLDRIITNGTTTMSLRMEETNRIWLIDDHEYRILSYLIYILLLCKVCGADSVLTSYPCLPQNLMLHVHQLGSLSFLTQCTKLDSLNTKGEQNDINIKDTNYVQPIYTVLNKRE